VDQSGGAAMEKVETVSLQQKFSLFSEHYKPHIIGEVNDAYVKAVKFKGPFLWHHHENEDEMFLVVKGTMRMKFRDHESVIREGEFIIVPRKVEHMPEADEEVHVILIEPKTTLNTGNVTNERTQPQLKAI
jgi:mannose-6-phosphate isomerase-like protein (cupin superfamily)